MGADQRSEVGGPERAGARDPFLADCRTEPCTLVIFGASGDLTARKLFPAVYNLQAQGGLAKEAVVVGAARTEMSDQGFREAMAQAVKEQADFREEVWSGLAGRLFYQQVDYQENGDFEALARRLEELEQRFDTRGNRIFYLAVPPSLYPVLSDRIGGAGLSRPDGDGHGWSRIVVEKPFGRDLKTAMDLDRTLHRSFSEDQIFRIDHYLAKETVQNVLMFRFANSVYEPIWNRRYIEAVRIIAAESLGVEHRARYYEQAGVLRDMFQNHMMQLLALTAMEPPSFFTADLVRDEKAKVYRSLRTFPRDRLEGHLVLGQYARGAIEGREAAGYHEEPLVDPASKTPTFALLKVFIDNWRWQGVPFYLISGKRLARKRTAIDILFKEPPHSMFGQERELEMNPNQLTLSIQPEEKIAINLQAKTPGTRPDLRSVRMEVPYYQDYEGPLLEAYEKVLLDVILGDQLLFWREDGVELCWSFLTPILEECSAQCEGAAKRLDYPAGSWGPEKAGELLPPKLRLGFN